MENLQQTNTHASRRLYLFMLIQLNFKFNRQGYAPFVQHAASLVHVKDTVVSFSLVSRR